MHAPVVDFRCQGRDPLWCPPGAHIETVDFEVPVVGEHFGMSRRGIFSGHIFTYVGSSSSSDEDDERTAVSFDIAPQHELRANERLEWGCTTDGQPTDQPHLARTCLSRFCEVCRAGWLWLHGWLAVCL